MWQNLVSNLSALYRLASYSDFMSEFEVYGESLFSVAVSRLGWEPRDTDSEFLCFIINIYCIL